MAQRNPNPRFATYEAQRWVWDRMTNLLVDHPSALGAISITLPRGSRHHGGMDVEWQFHTPTPDSDGRRQLYTVLGSRTLRSNMTQRSLLGQVVEAAEVLKRTADPNSVSERPRRIMRRSLLGEPPSAPIWRP